MGGWCAEALHAWVAAVLNSQTSGALIGHETEGVMDCFLYGLQLLVFIHVKQLFCSSSVPLILLHVNNIRNT